jgi:hypothetical protein
VSSTVDRRRNRICSGCSPPFSLSRFLPSPPTPRFRRSPPRLLRGGGGGGGGRDPRAIRVARRAGPGRAIPPRRTRLGSISRLTNCCREQQPPPLSSPPLSLSLSLSISPSHAGATNYSGGSADIRVYPSDIGDLFDSPSFSRTDGRTDGRLCPIFR